MSVFVDRRHDAPYCPVEPEIDIQRRRLTRLGDDAEVEPRVFGKYQGPTSARQEFDDAPCRRSAMREPPSR